MKNHVFRTCSFFLFLVFLAAFDYPIKTNAIHQDSAQEDVTIEPCNIQNRTFQNGEEITYKMYYNWKFVWLAAGEVTFKVVDMGDQYHLSAFGKTYKEYEWFFKVRDKYDTYIDKETLLPNVSIRDIEEGKYRLYDEVTFDKSHNVAKSFRGKSKDKAQMTDYPIDACMHDILSIIYFVRNVEFQDMSAGSEIPIKIFMDKETWPLKVRYKGKDGKKKVKGAGKFKTIRFSPEVIVGTVFNEDAQMDVWVTDDKNKIPVLIESPVSVGSVKAVLKEYKGLKYNMEAKVN